MQTARSMPGAPTLIHSWQDVELFACLWAQRLGYPDAWLTPAGQDGGIDVLAAGAVSQAKHWLGNGRPKKVGRPEVQKLRGTALPGQASLFFATSGYSRHAITWADSFPRVFLFRLRLDGHVEAVNFNARRLLLDTPPLPDSTPPPMSLRLPIGIFAVAALSGNSYAFFTQTLPHGLNPLAAVYYGFTTYALITLLSMSNGADMAMLVRTARRSGRLKSSSAPTDRPTMLSPPESWPGYQPDPLGRFVRRFVHIPFYGRVLASWGAARYYRWLAQRGQFRR